MNESMFFGPKQNILSDSQKRTLYCRCRFLGWVILPEAGCKTLPVCLRFLSNNLLMFSILTVLICGFMIENIAIY